MEVENLLKIIHAVSESTLTGFKYEEKGVKISLSKEMPHSSKNRMCDNAVLMEDAKVLEQSDYASTITVPNTSEEIVESAEASKKEGNLVTSLLVGTFYAAPAEDAEPFVKIGDRVEVGQTLGIVEAMKLMNDIESEFSGEVVEIYVENGAAVEYGQPLFRIK